MAKREAVLWETENVRVIGEVDDLKPHPEPGDISYNQFFDPAPDFGWVEAALAIVGAVVLVGLAVVGAVTLIVAVLT